MRTRSAAILASTAFLTFTTAARGAEPKSAIELQIEQLKLEAELQKQKNEITKLEVEQVKAIGLPNFEGKTETDANTGKFEATVMAAIAMEAVAVEMAAALSLRADNQKILVLAAEEPFQFGFASGLKFEMDRVRADFEASCGDPCLPKEKRVGPEDSSVAGAVAIASNIAGLLRSDVKLTTVTIDKIDSKFLASSVASKMGGKAILNSGNPGFIIRPPDAKRLIELSDRPNWEKAGVDERYFWLIEASRLLDVEVARISKLPSSTVNAKQLAKLNALATRYKEFGDRVVKADATGATPLIIAIKDDKVSNLTKYVARIFVREAGGSTKVSKNIGTFFGVDPLRVTGGLIASYTLFDPADGTSPRADAPSLWVCTSGYRRLRAIRPSSIAPECTPAVPAKPETQNGG